MLRLYDDAGNETDLEKYRAIAQQVKHWPVFIRNEDEHMGVVSRMEDTTMSQPQNAVLELTVKQIRFALELAAEHGLTKEDVLKAVESAKYFKPMSRKTEGQIMNELANKVGKPASRR